MSPESLAPPALDHYIRVYDDVIPQAFCEVLVQLFEAHPEHRERAQTSATTTFAQLNLMSCQRQLMAAEARHTREPSAKLRMFENHLQRLQQTFVKASQRYHQDVGSPLFPARPGFEEFRLKRYLPGGAEAFPLHIDATNQATARRFLIMFLYLNDVEEGGETGFPQWGRGFKPRAGRLLMFPPFWLYPHTGEPPRSGPKYILGTYLHYPA